MPTIVDVENIGEVEFPDGMSPEQIKSELDKHFGKSKGTGAPIASNADRIPTGVGAFPLGRDSWKPVTTAPIPKVPVPEPPKVETPPVQIGPPEADQFQRGLEAPAPSDVARVTELRKKLNIPATEAAPPQLAKPTVEFVPKMPTIEESPDITPYDELLMNSTVVGKTLEKMFGKHISAQVMRNVHNQVGGLAEFPTSPIGAVGMVAAPVAPATVAGAFLADTVWNLGKRAFEAHEGWANYTPLQKASVLTEMIGSAGMAGLLAHGVHAARQARATVGRAKEAGGKLSPTTLGLERLKANLANIAGAPEGVRAAEAKPAEVPPVPPVAPQPAAEQPKETYAVQEPSAVEEVLREPRVRGEGELPGVGTQDQLQKPAEQVEAPAQPTPQAAVTPPDLTTPEGIASQYTTSEMAREGRKEVAAVISDLNDKILELKDQYDTYSLDEANLQFGDGSMEGVRKPNLRLDGEIEKLEKSREEMKKVRAAIGKRATELTAQEKAKGKEVVEEAEVPEAVEAAAETLETNKVRLSDEDLWAKSASGQKLSTEEWNRMDQLEAARKEVTEAERQAIQAEIDKQAAKYGQKVIYEEDLPVKDQRSSEDMPFAGAPRLSEKGWMKAQGNNEIFTNRDSMQQYLLRFRPERRSRVIQSMFEEEAIHNKVIDAIPTRDVVKYWDDLTGLEQRLNIRRYTGEWGRPGDISEAQLGHEAIRFRLQRAWQLEPLEFVQTAMSERWTLKSLTALEELVRGAREALGTGASQRQLRVLSKIQNNLMFASLYADTKGADQKSLDALKEYREQIQQSDLPEAREMGEEMFPDERKDKFDADKLLKIDEPEFRARAAAMSEIRKLVVDWGFDKTYGGVDRASGLIYQSFSAARFGELRADPRIQNLVKFWEDYPDRKAEAIESKMKDLIADETRLRVELDRVQDPKNEMDPAARKASAEEIQGMLLQNDRDQMLGINAMQDLDSHRMSQFPEARKRKEKKGQKQIFKAGEVEQKSVPKPVESESFAMQEKLKRQRAAEQTANLGVTEGRFDKEGKFEWYKEERITGAELGLKNRQQTVESTVRKLHEYLDGKISSRGESLQTMEADPFFKNKGGLVEKGYDIRGEVAKVARRIKRPNYRDFFNWAKRETQMPDHVIRDLWENSAMDHLISASPRRLEEWARAMGLSTPSLKKGQAKYGQLIAPQETLEALPPPTPATGLTPEIAKRVWGEGWEAKYKQALEGGEKKFFGMPAKVERKIAKLRVQADELFKKAAALQLIEEAGAKQGTFEKETVRGEGRMSIGDMTAKARDLEFQADMLEKAEHRPEELVKGRNVRNRLIADIWLKLIEESKPKDEALQRTDVGVWDIAWGDQNAKIIGPYREITNEMAYRPDGTPDFNRLNRLFAEGARVSSTDPPNWTRRLAAMINKKTGETAIVSVWRRPISRAEIATGKAKRPFYRDKLGNVVTLETGHDILVQPPTGGVKSVPLESVMKDWRPFASIMLKEPTVNFVKQFPSIREYNDYLGTAVKEYKTKEFGDIVSDAPPEVRKQFLEDDPWRGEGEMTAEAEGELSALDRWRAGERFKEGELGEVETEAGLTEMAENLPAKAGMAGPVAERIRAAQGMGGGQLRRNIPMTYREAGAIKWVAENSVLAGEIKTPRDMRKVITYFAYRARSGKLRPKDWLAISALRKAAGFVFIREKREIARERRDAMVRYEIAKKAGKKVEPPAIIDFTREDAYVMALQEMYDLITKTKTEADFAANALERFRKAPDVLGRFADPELVRQTRQRAREARTNYPRELIADYTRPPTVSPWEKYVVTWRGEAINSIDPYQRWLARYSRVLPPTVTQASAGHWADMVKAQMLNPEQTAHVNKQAFGPGAPEPSTAAEARDLAQWLESKRYGAAPHPTTGQEQLSPITEARIREQQARESFKPKDEPYSPTASAWEEQAKLREELEQRNLTLSEYDSGDRPGVRNPENEIVDPSTFTYANKQVSELSAKARRDIAEHDRMRSAIAEEGSTYERWLQRKAYDKWLSQNQRLVQKYSKIIERNQGDLPEARMTRKVASDTIRYLAKRAWNTTIKEFRGAAKAFGELKDDVVRGRPLKETALGVAAEAKRYVQRKYQRRMVAEDMYAYMDSMEKSAISLGNATATSIRLASEYELPLLRKTAEVRKMNEEVGRKNRNAALAAIASTVKIVDQKTGEPVLVTRLDPATGIESAEPLTQISEKRLRQITNQVMLGIAKANDMIRGKNFEDRRIGRKWKEAAEYLMEGIKDLEKARQRSRNTEIFKSGPIWQSAKVFRDAMDNVRHELIDNNYYVREFENYVPGVYEGEIWLNEGISFSTEQHRLGGGIKKPKTFRDYYEAISKGPYIPVNSDLSVLAQHSITASQKMINRQMWSEWMMGLKDPFTGKNVAVTPSMVKGKKQTVDPETGAETLTDTWIPQAPKGYDLVYSDRSKNSRPIAVMHQFAPHVQNALWPSPARYSEIFRKSLTVASALKHGVVLILDVFHPMRLMQYGWAGGGKQMHEVFSANGFKGGWTAVNVFPTDMPKAVATGMVTQEAANWAMGKVKVNVTKFGKPSQVEMTRQEIAHEMLNRHGLNALQLTDAMYRNSVQNIPIIGKKWASFLEPFNELIFGKITTGLMVESAVRNFERLNAARPNVPHEKLMREVAKDTNIIYGNLGRQGIFKDPAIRDLASIILLAPAWREGLIQKDVRALSRLSVAGFKAGVKATGLGYKQTKWGEFLQPSTLGYAYTRGLVAYFIVAQMINMITRGHSTMQNPEEGRNSDAWIPTGKDSGVWFPMMGVFGEVVHQMGMLMDSKQTTVEAGLQFTENAMGPVGRFWHALRTGEDSDGQKATSSAKWMFNALSELGPFPITLQFPGKAIGSSLPGVREIVDPNKPGEWAQRLAGMVGVKVNRAPKYSTLMNRMVRQFNEENSFIPEAFQDVPTDQPAFSDLRNAIRNNNRHEAKKIYRQLKEQLDKAPKITEESMRPSSEIIYDAMVGYLDSPWTGSREKDDYFISWMNEDQNKIWQEAVMERIEEQLKFQTIFPDLEASAR